MNFNEIKNRSMPHFYSIKIDNFLSRAKRKVLRMTFALLAFLSFVFSFDSLPLHFGSADGFFFLFLMAFLALFFLELFYRSMMNEGLHSKVQEDRGESSNLDFALSQIIFATDEIDVVRALFETKVGFSIFGRLGVGREDAQKFIYENRIPLVASSFEFQEADVNLVTYAKKVFESDKSFREFLSKRGISKESFLHSVEQTMKAEERKRRRERFWSRESLGAIPSVGSNPFFEIARRQNSFAEFLSLVPSSDLDIYSINSDEEVSLLESLLVEGKSVALISQDKSISLEKVEKLSKKISLGVALPQIEHKKLLSFDTQKFLGSVSGGDLVNEVAKAFAVAQDSRIIFIHEFSTLLLKLKESKSDAYKGLLGAGPQLIVAINEADYKFFVETSNTLSQKFSKISLS